MNEDDILKLFDEEISYFDETILPEDSVFGHFSWYASKYHCLIQKELCNKKFSYVTKYIDDMQVNAFSLVHNNNFIMLINKGTVMKLYDFYYKVWTSSLLFPNTGKCEPIDKLIVGEPEIINNGIRFYTNHIDANRQRLAEAMAEFAVEFIILHELSHLYSGHVQYLKALTKLNFLEMIPKKHSTIRNKLYDKKLLEFDADSSAMRLLFSDYNANLDFYLSNIKQYRISEKDAPYFFICSLSFLFRFIYMNNEKVTNGNREYLSIPYRVLTIYDELIRIRQIEDSPKFLPGKDEDECSEFFSCIEDQVSLIMQDVFGINNYAYVDDLEDEIMYSAYLDIRSNWKEIYPELLQYSKIPLMQDYEIL